MKRSAKKSDRELLLITALKLLMIASDETDRGGDWRRLAMRWVTELPEEIQLEMLEYGLKNDGRLYHKLTPAMIPKYHEMCDKWKEIDRGIYGLVRFVSGNTEA